MAKRAGGGPKAVAAGCYGLGGAARDGEGGGTRGSTRGNTGQWGRGGGKLGQPAKADARPGAEQSEEEQVRESAGEWELGVHLYTAQGRQGAWQRRQGTRQGSSAMVATSTDTRRP